MSMNQPILRRTFLGQAGRGVDSIALASLLQPVVGQSQSAPADQWAYTTSQEIAQLQGSELQCLAPQHPFNKRGQSGQEIVRGFPHPQKVADELCIIRSMTAKAINHDPAHTFTNT